MNKTVKTMLAATLAFATLCTTAFAAPRQPPRNAAPPAREHRGAPAPRPERRAPKHPAPKPQKHREAPRRHHAPPPPPRRHHGGTTLHTGDWVAIGTVGVVAGLVGAILAN